ncbi:hypothetical protein VTO42DRAFT_6503 [Malbranchea cinnamomea]
MGSFRYRVWSKGQSDLPEREVYTQKRKSQTQSYGSTFYPILSQNVKLPNIARRTLERTATSLTAFYGVQTLKKSPEDRLRSHERTKSE